MNSLIIIWFAGFAFLMLCYFIFVYNKSEVPMLSGVISSLCWPVFILALGLLIITLPVALVYVIWRGKNVGNK